MPHIKRLGLAADLSETKLNFFSSFHANTQEFCFDQSQWRENVVGKIKEKKKSYWCLDLCTDINIHPVSPRIIFLYYCYYSFGLQREVEKKIN